MPKRNKVQEIQLWMPYGDQGEGNLPSLDEYINIAIRKDGALPGTIADHKTYNKVLYQLTRMAQALAIYINKFGYPVPDAASPEELSEYLIAAFREAVFDTLDPENPDENNPGYAPDITYECLEVVLTKRAAIDSPVKVLKYDVGRPAVMVYFDGLLIRKGTGTETAGTPVWYEVGEEKTVSDTIKFRFDIPAGAPLQIVRYGDLRYETEK